MADNERVTSAAEVSLAGRVAIVTGAGGGLGRSHALLLARRGARVVVNDVGAAPEGAPQAASAADAVAGQIRDESGNAVADTHSVATSAAAIVDRALQEFGRVDIVVNNAGIVRDRSFAKMSPSELDEVLSVHLVGGFAVTQAAWPHLREQAYGRIINTTSGAGLFGNFGQANYSAAKMGLVGLTRTLALEGRKYGIMVNAVAPLAASQMTEQIMPPEALARLDPDAVSPVVAYLASEQCSDSGLVLTTGGGFVARVAIVEGPGVALAGDMSPEDVAAKWTEITTVGSFTEYWAGAGEQAEAVLGRL